MNKLLFLIPLLPLIGFTIIGLTNKSLPKFIAAILACSTLGVSFVLSILLFITKLSDATPIHVTLFSWIHSGSFDVSFSFYIDALSSLFLLIITGVGFLIHVYSAGYMHEDEGFNRFFSYLNLFIFFMLLLVMGDSYLLMFVGWEGVGLCSYLLIGFWFKNIEYSKAAKKAFIINRIGDLGLLLGMFLLFTQFGSLNFKDVLFSNQQLATVNVAVITTATLLLFVGAIGKSAQIPLYTWLPDAMAGPTPVSALIHAATMVTAGIYMIARSNVLFTMAPITLNVILIIGIATSLLAAIIALFQNDIKKVLAYSTVSQLGLMFAALGVGAYSAAVFHVLTHAFFKALLFLAAGSVIHGMHGEQDIRKMGGLTKYLPITFFTFLIGTIAIAGIPPFAGFFSKDQILAELLYQKGPIVFGFGIIISLMTAFYMFRLLFLTFFGKFRGTEHQQSHLHESPISMTLPLIILSIFAMGAGFIGFPHQIGTSLGIHNWLDGFLSQSVSLTTTHWSANHEWILVGTTSGLILIVIIIAYMIYVSKNLIPESDENIIGVKRFIYNKLYIDELYNYTITQPINKISEVLEKYFDTLVVDGLVNATGKIVRLKGQVFAKLQTGNTGTYLLAMVFAIIVILVISLF